MLSTFEKLQSKIGEFLTEVVSEIETQAHANMLHCSGSLVTAEFGK